MKVITITGWGQQLDSLDQFSCNFGSVTNIPYVNLKGVEELFLKAREIGNPDIIIGWSLGAQLASRIVAAGILSPKLLVLLAPPYQYIKNRKIKHGIHPLSFNAFKMAYDAFPGNTLRKFGAMVCQNDDHAMSIIETMDEDTGNHKGWVRWLDELANFSCLNLNFANFPRTVIFHGDGDVVTPPEQGKLFHQAIKGSRLEILEHCGHAPHLHDPEYVVKVITEELRNATFQNKN